MQVNRAFTRLCRIVLAPVLVMSIASGLAGAQQAKPDGHAGSGQETNNKQQKKGSDKGGAKQGKPENNTPMTAVATVNASVTVEAGLLPYDAAKQLFGGWVADHFAVVQVTIGNHSRDQQFILQDIYFDYSHWALSGLYSGGTANAPTRNFKDYQQGTNPGEISSIGALEVHDGLKSASTFSPRNKWVGGLVLIGTTAGGFAFLGPAGFTQAVTGYNSAFIPGLQKFWPDRTIDQQSNLLKYGYQDKMVIAKEDPGKTYGFFPIDRFLTSGLAKLYLKEPAIFFNPAELFLDPTIPSGTDSCASTNNGGKGRWHSADCKQLASMKTRLVDILRSATGKELSDAQILTDLTSPCNQSTLIKANAMNGDGHGKPGVDAAKPADGKGTSGEGSGDASARKDGSIEAEKPEEEACPLDLTKPDQRALLFDIVKVKALMTGASLNSARIVVSGIMTVDVETVPAVIASVTFDKQSKGETFWKDTKSKQTGVIDGRFLTNGKPVITGIKLPEAKGDDSSGGGGKPKSDVKPKPEKDKSGKDKDKKKETTSGDADKTDASSETEGKDDDTANEKTDDKCDDDLVDCYIVKDSLVAVEDGSTDSELHFSVQFKKQIPAGATLLFQVVKTSSKAVNSGDGKPNASETTTSMTYDYVVDYKSTAVAKPPAPDAVKPTITKLDFGKSETGATWAKTGTAIAGTVTGTDLKDGSVDVVDITVPGVKAAEWKTYCDDCIQPGKDQAEDGKTLAFTVTLGKKVPPGSILSFQVKTTDAKDKELASNVKTHKVPALPVKQTPPPKADQKPKTDKQKAGK